MINIEYLNGSSTLEADLIYKPFESFMESSKTDINNLCSNFNMLQERVMLESSIMGSIPENMQMVYESEKKNFFERVGEMVVAIYKKFVEFIDKIIDKIKTYSFSKKSDLQKLETLLKHHPDLKDEAIVAFQEGALDFSDVRSLKELDSTFDEILKMARKKDIDPKTLRGKWEKAKEKFEKIDQSTVVKVAKATSVVIGAAVAIKTLPAVLANHKNRCDKDKQEARERQANVLDTLKHIQNEDGENVVTEDTGIGTLIVQMNRELNGYHGAVQGKNLSTVSKFVNAIAKFVDKFDNGAGKRLYDDLTETKSRMDKAVADKRSSDIKFERDKAYNQAAARNAAPTPKKD